MILAHKHGIHSMVAHLQAPLAPTPNSDYPSTIQDGPCRCDLHNQRNQNLAIN